MWEAIDDGVVVRLHLVGVDDWDRRSLNLFALFHLCTKRPAANVQMTNMAVHTFTSVNRPDAYVRTRPPMAIKKKR